MKVESDFHNNKKKLEIMLNFFSLNQRAMIDFGLTANESFLIAYYYSLSNWAEHVIIDGKVYYWVSRLKAAEDLPFISMKEGEELGSDSWQKRNKDTFFRLNKSLDKKGLIIYAKQGLKDMIHVDPEAAKDWFKDQKRRSFIMELEEGPEPVKRKDTYPYTLKNYDVQSVDFTHFEKEKKGTWTDAITRTIESFNSITGKNYPVIGKKSKKTRAIIAGAFKRGFTESELLQVIELKFSQWFANQKSRTWIRPSTMFGGKLEDYVQEAKTTYTDERSNNAGRKNGKQTVIEPTIARSIFEESDSFDY
jgi:uncharacterized phage protein (TIGR02220 family)